MSAFREALKARGLGEWIVETCSPSGDVHLRKLNEHAPDREAAIPAPVEGGATKAAA